MPLLVVSCEINSLALVTLSSCAGVSVHIFQSTCYLLMSCGAWLRMHVFTHSICVELLFTCTVCACVFNINIMCMRALLPYLCFLCSPFLTISLCRAGHYLSHPVFSVLCCYVFSQLVFLHVSLYVIPICLFRSASAPSPRNLPERFRDFARMWLCSCLKQWPYHFNVMVSVYVR